jgi:hypothetical protein
MPNRIQPAARRSVSLAEGRQKEGQAILFHVLRTMHVGRTWTCARPSIDVLPVSYHARPLYRLPCRGARVK